MAKCGHLNSTSLIWMSHFKTKEVSAFSHNSISDINVSSTINPKNAWQVSGQDSMQTNQFYSTKESKRIFNMDYSQWHCRVERMGLPETLYTQMEAHSSLGSIQQTGLVYQTGTFITPESVFPVPQQCALHLYRRHLALCILDMCLAAKPWKHISFLGWWSPKRLFGGSCTWRRWYYMPCPRQFHPWGSW